MKSGQGATTVRDERRASYSARLIIVQSSLRAIGEEKGNEEKREPESQAD